VVVTDSAGAEWRLLSVGRLDGRRGPFRGASRFPDGQPLTVDLGSEDWADRWPAYQPGPLDAEGGFRSATLEVIFSLERLPLEATHLRLRLAVLSGRGPCPQLDVGLNGRSGRLYLSPVRPDRTLIMGAQTMIGAWAQRELAVPVDCLRVGENHLSFTTRQEEAEEDPPPPAALRRPAPFWGGFGSGLSWGGLALDALGGPPPAASVRIVPTPMFVAGPGGPAELIDVVARDLTGFGRGQVEIVVEPARPLGPAGELEGRPSGRSEGTGEGSAEDCGARGSAVEELAEEGTGERVALRAEVDPSGRDFGEWRVRVAVPEAATGGAERTYRCLLRLDEREVRAQGSYRASRHWTIHLLPHVHLDLGYTDRQGKVAELHARNLDRALEWIERDRSARFWVDGSWILARYFDGRSADRRRRLLAELRAGRVATNAFDALVLSGVADTDVLLRALGRAERLAAEDGVPISFANLTDVPSYSVALATLLAHRNVRCFFGVANHGRGANEDGDEIHLRSPWRWRGPDGAHVVAFFSDGYSQLRQLATDPVTTAGLAEALGRWLARYERPDYLPSDLPVVGLHTDNEDFDDLPVEAVAAWNERYVAPRLRWSTPPEYFGAIEPLADRLPVLEGDGGSYWEDGVGSDPQFVSRYRRAVGRLAAAESLAALIRSRWFDLATPPGVFARAWEDLGLAVEHTWTWAHVASHPEATQSRDQLRWKHDALRRAERVAIDEGERAMSRLAERVATVSPAVLVYNPLAWSRPVVAHLEVSPETAFEAPPGEAEVAAVTLGVVDGLAEVALRVPDVPAFGYRVVRMGRGQRPVVPVDRRLDGEHWSGEVALGRYDLVFDRATGRIQSLSRRSDGMELVDATSPFPFAGPVVTAGGGTARGRGRGREATRLIEADPSLPWPAVSWSAPPLRPVVQRRLPDGDVVVLAGSGDRLADVCVELAFFDDDDAIDVRVVATLEATLAKSALYVAFPFRLAEPSVRFDRQVGWVDPARDQLPGSCQDWYTHFHAVVLEGRAGEGADPVRLFWASEDAPLFCLGDVVRGRWARRPLRSATVLSYVANNHWNTNYRPAQGGRLELHYRFGPLGEDPLAEAARRGRELRSSPLVGTVGWLDKAHPRGGDLPENGASLFPASPCSTPPLPTALPLNVDLTCRCAPEGVLLRAQELAGREASLLLPAGRGGAGSLPGEGSLRPFGLLEWTLAGELDARESETGVNGADR